MTTSMKGNLDPLRVHFRGYDASARAFLLCMGTEAHLSVTAAKRRDMGDFQALDRALAHRDKRGNDSDKRPALPRLSLRRLKKLTEHGWERDNASAGWRRELQKNVAACEQWLEQALGVAIETIRTRFVDDDAYAAHHRARTEEQAKAQRAKQLQQYFTSNSLIQHVVTRLGEVLVEIEFPSIESEHVMWLEPSCGDGRIVDALVAAGAKRVVGCELDERVWTVAHAKLKHVDNVTLELGDFLASVRPPADRLKTVMALGNPPFGGDGSNQATGVPSERDLVTKFVIHSARAWSATLVAFIVPSRCAKPVYLAALLTNLNDTENRAEEPADGFGKAWTIVLCELLDDCTFEFQETKRVKQPSAFVVFALQSSTP